MFIRRFRVKNFMIHRDTEIRLQPLTVLVGPNNGGKSAFFSALTNFSMVSRGRLSQAFGPGPYSYRSKKSHGTAPAARISYEVDLSEASDKPDELTYSVSYSQTAGSSDLPRYQIFDESLRTSRGHVLFDRADIDSSELRPAAEQVTEDQTIFAALRRAQFSGDHERVRDALVADVTRDISRIGTFRLNPQFLLQASPLPDVQAGVAPGAGDASGQPSPAPSLDYRGEGLATVLYYMTETASPALDSIVARLRESIAGFESFEFNVVGADRVGFSVKFGDARGLVAAANLSDGTLSLIGLTVLLLNPSRQPIICIEEPENGLTPRSTRFLYEMLRSAAHSQEVGSQSQILVSSHSPYVITEAWNGADRAFIYQVKPSNEGRAVVRPFADAVAEHGLQLELDRARNRTRLNLNVADAIMDGYLS